ncbi:hypothetical protein QTP88_013292 [Uroleucon formosanum]
MAKEHLESEISRGQYSTNNRLDVRFRLTTNNQIAENREIVRVIFEILLYLGRQNIAFRGHDESLTSKNRGNFLSLIKVLSKYHALLAIHLNKIENSSKQNRITFLSGQTQNVMLQIMSDSIRSVILKKVKDSRMFAVIIDTTIDISKLEQFTFVIRFVNYEGIVEERLIALEIATDATGHGMFQLFSTICEKHGLDWKNNLYTQAYDGAASMQGPYSGLRTLIQQQYPRAKYIWCCAHIINLVIVDMCDSCLDTHNFFGEIQALVEYFGARKRTACFINHQKLLYPGQEQDFQVVRIRRKKRMDGENLHDEINEVSNTPSLLFKFQVYFFVLDTVSTVLNSRYSQAREVLKDLSLLFVERIKSFSLIQDFPYDSFDALLCWIPELNIESLRTEYSAFCNAYSSLTAGLNLGDTLHAQESDHDWSTNENYDEEEHTTCKSKKENTASMLQLLLKFNLTSAFPNLYLAYKALYTIPVTSAAAERTFSKVKIIKSRLRSTMSQLRLESLLLLNCETDINIDLNQAINELATSSTLMKKNVLYS